MTSTAFSGTPLECGGLFRVQDSFQKGRMPVVAPGKSSVSVLAPSCPRKFDGRRYRCSYQDNGSKGPSSASNSNSFLRPHPYWCSYGPKPNFSLRLRRRRNTNGGKMLPPASLAEGVAQGRQGLEHRPEAGEESEADDYKFETKNDVEDGNIIQETLNLFEWRAVCCQIAQFTLTPMGNSIAKDGNLTIGASRLQSEELLAQTAAALTLLKPLDFSGIESLHDIVMEAMSGNVCQIKDLRSVTSTLTGIQRLHDHLCGPNSMVPHKIVSKDGDTESGDLFPLQDLMSDSDLCADLVFEIDFCLDCTREIVLDRASPALAAARLSKVENMRALETLLKETASWVSQQGGIDSVVITRRRARLCIAVRSSHKSLLPGAVTLDVSNTGTTSFVEPEPALILNNEEMRLGGVEKVEELAVLRKLTMMLVDKAELILDLLDNVTKVDLACARASHAKWLGSVRPDFGQQVGGTTSSKGLDVNQSNPSLDSAHDVLLVDIEGIRHPLLLGPVLLNQFSLGLSGISSTVEASTAISGSLTLPVPIDIKVDSGVRVVTMTGPNTGGKTATLKTLGIASIMAKAGLFLPAVGQPRLPWFDIILGDIGDEQSLKRNLSTFSGHIRRLRAILEIATNRSLVLLDEIGGGTDPSEGAALAAAVLRYLSSRVFLCVATTHSAELKGLKSQDPKFENASVEFDVMTLRPTYRVLWGIPGQSNALNIAETLGFDMEVVTRARELMAKLVPSQLGDRTSEILVPLMKQCEDQLERTSHAAKVLANVSELYYELQEATEDLPKRESSWKQFQVQAVQEQIANAKVRMEKVIEDFQTAWDNCAADDNQPSIREAQAKIALILEELCGKQLSTLAHRLTSGDEGSKEGVEVNLGANSFSVGEKVFVKRLGKVPVTIIEMPQKDSKDLTVQLGTMKVRVKTTEVQKMKQSEGLATPRVEKISYTARKQSRDPMPVTETVEPQKFEVVVQTSKNTLDLRGMRVDDAVRELGIRLGSSIPQSVLFVVHGIGTGAVKEAVTKMLQKHPYVAKFEDESLTNAGCTLVYIK